MREGQAQGLSVGEERRESASAGSAPEHRSIGSRLVSTVRSALGISEWNPVSLQRWQAGETLHREVPPEGPVAELPPGSREAVEQRPASDSEALPWLSADENVQRQTIQRRLEEIQGRPDIPGSVRSDLCTLANSVYVTERLLLRVHNLQQKSRQEPMRESEWSDLHALGWRVRQDILREQTQVQEQFGQTQDTDATLPAVERLLEELQQRLANAHRYLCSNDAGWESAVRRISTELPIPARDRDSLTTRADVHSRVVPGTALGACFGAGYPSDDSINRFCAERYKHVPELALSVLRNEKRQVLFAGLRHGIVSANEIDGTLLERLSGADLQSLVAEFIVNPGARGPVDRTPAQRIVRQCESIRSSTMRARSAAVTIRESACIQMARESAAAALVADQAKLRRAIDGRKINVRLFTISLLAQEDGGNWDDQQRVFTEMNRMGPTALRVRAPNADGAERSVVANVKIRQFVLSAVNGPLNAKAYRTNSNELEWLVGPSHTHELGGDIAAGLDAMHARMARLRDRFVAMEEDHALTVQERGATHAHSIEQSTRILELQEKRDFVEKNARTLSEVGQQLKTMWLREYGLPRGVEAHKRAAARLALVGWLLGETPVSICASGSEFARQLDPEIKFLATVADNLNGYPPPVEEQMEVWGTARSAFTPQ